MYISDNLFLKEAYCSEEDTVRFSIINNVFEDLYTYTFQMCFGQVNVYHVNDDESEVVVCEFGLTHLIDKYNEYKKYKLIEELIYDLIDMLSEFKKDEIKIYINLKDENFLLSLENYFNSKFDLKITISKVD